MKQTERQTQRSKRTPQSDKLLSIVEETPKLNSTGLNEQGEEMIQRDKIENTPFVMITINNKTFGTFGKYRITEMYHTKQQCKIDLLRMDWNRVIQIMTLVNEMMKNQKTI
ncbi:MAG: hypothetical protein [Microviridae sp.]|nr:MAG: hypothetical protein [Microviridae sp.]